MEQRQFRPHRSSDTSRSKISSKTLGSQTPMPPLPDHDLEPPKFAQSALEFVMQDWRAVKAMIVDSCKDGRESR